MSLTGVSAAERRLRIAFPARLRDVYAEADGRFLYDGQWWVVWPLERLVAENEQAWRDGQLPSTFLAFGDDGIGEPFCVDLSNERDEVFRWMWIGREVDGTFGSVAEFLNEWGTGLGYPCPCCGYFTHREGPGNYEFCDVCGWQDDLSQLRFPTTAGGANRLSLIEAQKAYRVSAATVAPPDVERDPMWRPIDPDVDEVESPEPGTDQGLTYGGDPAAHYYWQRHPR